MRAVLIARAPTLHISSELCLYCAIPDLQVLDSRARNASEPSFRPAEMISHRPTGPELCTASFGRLPSSVFQASRERSGYNIL